MKEDSFAHLVQVIDKLLSPDGCPWDRAQTVETLAPMILEEAAEVMDALHEEDREHLLDEVGDLAITLLFLCKIAQKEGRFEWHEPFKKGAEKLIRRHPHIFEIKESMTTDEVIDQWDQLKKQERFHIKRQGCLEGIPEKLPIVARFQKLTTKLKKTSPDHYQRAKETLNVLSGDGEEEIGRKIAQLIFEANDKGVNVEMALRAAYFKLYKEMI